MKKIKVLLVFGGNSTEHEVSRRSAASIIKEIDYEKYDLSVLEVDKHNEYLLYNLSEKNSTVINQIIFIENNLLKKKIDLSIGFLKTFEVAFPIIHGTGGEDGKLQGLFEMADIAYVGANVLASSIGMDKAICKILFDSVNIPQASYLNLTSDDNIAEKIEIIEEKFSYPLFIKPANLGSSVGVTKAYNREQLIKGYNLCKKVDRKILIEEYIKGREIECAVIGDYNEIIASNVGEVILKSDFYSYEAKYINEEQTIVPNDIAYETQELIKEYAKKAFKVIDCYGLARVDFFITKDNKPILNEINTLPGFTSISMFPKLMIESGVSYSNLVAKLIESAMKRKTKYNYLVDFEEVK